MAARDEWGRYAAKPAVKPVEPLPKLDEEFEMYPPGTRLYRKFPANGRNATAETKVLLAEIRPGIYPIQTAYKDHDDRGRPSGTKGVYEVAMPWQYFVFRGVKYGNDAYYPKGYMAMQLFAYWSKHQLKRLNGPVIAAKIPDSEGGNICLGNMNQNNATLPFFAAVTNLLRDFYGQSTFTNMHSGGFNRPIKYQRAGGFPAWIKDSEENPFCYLGWEDFNKPPLDISGYFKSDSFYAGRNY